jgi:hypothetical protein
MSDQCACINAYSEENLRDEFRGRSRIDNHPARTAMTTRILAAFQPSKGVRCELENRVQARCRSNDRVSGKKNVWNFFHAGGALPLRGRAANRGANV